MVKKLIHKTWMTYRGCKVVEQKGVAMNRFSKLYKNSANFKAEQKLSMQLSRKQEAPEANANGTAGYMIKSGPRKNQIIAHKKAEKKKL